MDRLCFPFFWADEEENKEMGSLVIQGNSHGSITVGEVVEANNWVNWICNRLVSVKVKE